MQQLNLVGLIFFISDSALALLKIYRQGLYRYFASQPDGEEILADLEHHMAEIFWEQTNQNKIPISDSIVEAMMARMGSIADFEEADKNPAYNIVLEPQEMLIHTSKRTVIKEKERETLPTRTRFSFAPYTEEVWNLTAQRFVEDKREKQEQEQESDLNPNRLYRDSKRCMLGGVAAGFAHYFQIDVVWIRFLLLACFLGLVPTPFVTGTLVMVYIVLWVALPQNPNLPDIKIIKRLYRDLGDAKVGGVCAGLARYFGWSRKRVRTVFTISAFAGVGLVGYATLWAIMPKKKTKNTLLEELEASFW
jgi:phage shock protein PspC (stress-responsive transcriptional regulator)